MKRAKFNIYWRIFSLVIGALFILGIFSFLYLPNGRYTFIYENLIWFPVEITLIIIVINKILNALDKRKEKERFVKVTKRPTETIISSLKNNIVDIIHDRNIYDKNRPDTNALYEEIINDLDVVVTDQLILSTKSYSFNGSSRMLLNMTGILHVECKKLDDNLKKYIDRFHIFFDDDIYLKITELEKRNHNLGLLSYPLSMNGGNAETHKIGGDLDYIKNKIKDHILETNQFIKLLNEKLD